MERFILQLTRRLKLNGINVHVYTGSHFGTVVESDGVTQLPTRLTIMGNPIISGLSRVLLQGEYDVVHAHDEHAFTSNVVAYTMGHCDGRFVMHGHGSFTGGNLAWRLFVQLYMKTLGKYTLSRADANVALSPSEATILSRFGAKNIRVIPNAVDKDELNRHADPTLFRSHYNIHSNKLVLFVGRLIGVKGADRIPKIARLLNSVRDDTVFAVVGDGPLKSELQRVSRTMGLKNLVVTGRVPKEELSSAYNAADVVLVPSVSEGMPAVVLEALLFRKPVVATRFPTLMDYFADVCQFVEPNSIQGFAGALNRVLDRPPSDISLDEAERQVVERFNWNRVTREVIDIYRDLQLAAREPDNQVAIPK
jgi:glycosyltransferase involved in cell wall biosynthesis